MAAPQARFSTESSLRGLPAVELLDEAVALLRRAPLAILSIYFLGALPFCLGVIYFWFDMTESANAEGRLPGEAMMLTALYFWMKTCQAVFARKLLELVEGDDSERWTLLRWANTALLQIVYAGSLVLVYPFALLMTVPFGWVNAFYHSVSIVATGSRTTLGSSLREAMEMARLWPKQNHLILGLLFVAMLMVYLNLAVFCITIPQLLNMLFGIETVFVDNGFAWNNSSFYLDVSVFCYLVLNPLNKAIYVLRCFYGRSRVSGTDLKAELRRFQARQSDGAALSGVAAFVLIFLLLFGGAARAESDTSLPVSAPLVQIVEPATAKLDQAIQKTLQKDEFAWRAPRVESDSGEESFLQRMVNAVLKWIKHVLKAPLDWLGDWLKWLFDFHPRDQQETGNFLSAMAAIPWRAIFLLLAVILIAILAWLLFRHFRRKPPQPLDTLQPIALRTVDLEAENLQADELPEDSWLALAQQLIERGELRLALRAFYLATLSTLARQELVRLGPAKSNRDYLAELTRRLRGEAVVVPSFRESIRLFEASWYGTHAVTSAIIESMRANQKQVGSHAAA